MKIYIFGSVNIFPIQLHLPVDLYMIHIVSILFSSFISPKLLFSSNFLQPQQPQQLHDLQKGQQKIFFKQYKQLQI